MRKGGFTLIEVIIATVVAAMVVSIAAAIMTTATDAVAISRDQAQVATREANARRWIQDVLIGVSVANTPTSRFEGDPASVAFQSSYRVAEGWVERGRVAIEYDGTRLLGRLPNLDVVTLADSLRGAEFGYHLVGDATPWLSSWRSGATLPAAFRLRLARLSGSTDTLLFYIGERR